MLDILKGQRTYALVGHGGSGKTSVAEMLLFAAGEIDRMGKIEDGTTNLDFEPEEIKRRGSTQPAFTRLSWKKNPHFLIDIPGDNNFTGDMTYLLASADAAILVIDAVDGVKPLTRKVWSQIREAGLPAVIVINKMDRDRADFDTAYASINEQLGVRPVLLHLPIGQRESFSGVVDVLGGTAMTFDDKGGVAPAAIPADMADNAQLMRETMVENIAESDEALMEAYLEEGALSPEQVAEGLAKGVAAGAVVPVVVCAALENKGGGLLLDIIQDLLPSPLFHAPWVGDDGATRPSTPDEPVAAFVCKTIADPYAGQLSVLRVLSGTLASDMSLANPDRDGKERCGQLLYLKGKETVPCKEPVGPGGIVAVAKLKNTRTGDTLCDEKARFVLDRPAVPGQLITYALAAAEKGEEDKVFQAVQKLLDEDISLRLFRDEETGDILLSGMGQLHIETAVEKAKRRFKVGIVLKTPKVPYRETIKGKADVQGRHKKQTGGRGQFGDCFVRFEPRPHGGGYEFEDAIVGGSIPRQYIPAVDKGIQESAARGVLSGNPVVDFKATLYDGSYHNVDSSEMAFKIAGSLAFKKACEIAGMKLLEPYMTVSVSVPDQYMGDIIGDLSSRRGKVLGSDSTGGVTEIKAHVPMNEILRYAPDLRSMTGGQGVFAMEFSHYEEAPPPVTERVVAEYRKSRGEE
ncbi:small GTP-binding protein [Desulfovibrio sp. X2]|uniref:elongation factor G n=1 Tax=Desulfovibrio sp. X2 TaxID=941449 RepID=UPI000358705C|nr:elongation factor G [Desulfovibrio sp. X2]EPR44327.1 small GTP-binding protein [Desulfovibrio sp. X2]